MKGVCNLDTNSIIMSWKNPKLRKKVQVEHPAGKGFQELSVSEMNFIAGGNVTVQPQATPATPIISKISMGVSGAAASFVVSYISSAAFDCRD